MTDFKKTIYSLHPTERQILPYLKEENIDTLHTKSELTKQESWLALQLLEQKEFVKINKETKQLIELDSAGKKFCTQELPEYQILIELNGKKKKISEINLEQETINGGLGELKKQELINIEKNKELTLEPTNKAQEFLNNYSNPLKYFETPLPLDSLDETHKQIYEQLKKRKGFLKTTTSKEFSFNLTQKGIELVNEFINKYTHLDLIENLTTDMLKNKEWKNKEFRHYDPTIETPPASIGRLHPMLEANDILSQKLLEMGFKEMKGPLVESAFWNMDMLWIPQDHPAREEQDTFYLEGETQLPQNIKEKVATMHENGIKKAHTPKGEFSYDEASRKLLRTHSTPTSFRKLYELSKKKENGENINGKYFYLAKVFRNETTDATHLAEFYQGEGFIIGDNLSLGHLMGFVKEYLQKLGYESIHFKPTFNPYTEPSMEAHVYDKDIDKSYAVINSGIFRPETLKPLGLEDKTIIAWGIGASRIAAKLSGRESMREITGSTCDFEWLQQRPIMEDTIKGGKK